MSLPIVTVLVLFILGTVVVFMNNYSSIALTYAQFQNNTSSSPLLGVNITSPQKGQMIPTNISDLSISGKSTDRPTADDCKVSVIVNGVKPYQSTIANGTTGQNNDYSKWFFTLDSNYTSIKEGANKITAKLSCPSDVDVANNDNNMTKWYSINVTGITTRNANITNTPSESPPVINSSALVESNNNDYEKQSVEPKIKGEQETPIFDAENNNDKKIGKDTENLRERIMEGVERSLDEIGIDVNLH